MMSKYKSSISNYLLIIAAIVTIFVFLTGFATLEPIGNTDSAPTTHTVTIFKMKFDPANISVKKGDTVVWVNKDFFPHDVTEETNQEWTSKPFNQGEKWSKVVNKDIKYFCNLHKVMKGTIKITK